MNRDEEYFLLMVAAEASESNPTARQVFNHVADQHLSGEPPRALQTIRLVESIYHGDSRAVKLARLGDVVGVKADAARIDRVTEKIARGLHFLDFHEPVPEHASIRIEVNPVAEVKARLLARFHAAPLRVIGPEFSYRCLRDGGRASWWMSFYETVPAWAWRAA